jgi:SAM-dependent methyltransferase
MGDTNMHSLEDVKNEAYYDAVAPVYNQQLQLDSSNHIVRMKVSNYFCQSIKPGKVLDFGGGTGLDLHWLLQGHFDVVFCEPSMEMKRKAMKQIVNHPRKDSVLFLEPSNSHVAQWSNTSLPFENLDGGLANFAVLNNISDMRLTFANLARVIKPGGHFIATILDTSFRFGITRYAKFFPQLLLGKSAKLRSLFGNTPQYIYLHPLEKVARDARPHFVVANSIALGGYGFRLVHLIKK